MAKRFEDLVFKPKRDGLFSVGVQARVFFPNGYGASVIQSPYSYGGEDGLYELAVLAGDERHHDLTYKTPITDDVLGRLTEQEVSDALAQIAALPVLAEQSA